MLSLPLLLAALTAALPVPTDLPARVHLKTRTESFTSRHEVAVRDGRLFYKQVTSSFWQPMPGDGLPSGDGFEPPRDIREISADGDNLIAVSEEGQVYYMKWGTMAWTTAWGLPPVRTTLRIGFENRGLAISHRGPDAGYYEDIDGNQFPISAGVTTYYALGADGRTLTYADPWLPADFNREICGPRRGRFVAEAMSASGSTLFVVDRSGTMFTRLADFDTLGENPVLQYSYRRQFRRGRQVRTLPPEDWREQPPVPGRITKRVTILQTGKGNAARELRVEGLDASGAGGYWAKPIYADAWTFVATGQRVEGPFLANGAGPEPRPSAEELLGPSRESAFAGTLSIVGQRQPVIARLEGYSRYCSPASLVAAGLPMTLHFRKGLPLLGGKALQFSGTLMRPESSTPEQARLVKALFGKKPFVDVVLSISADGQRAEVLRLPSWKASLTAAP